MNPGPILIIPAIPAIPVIPAQAGIHEKSSVSGRDASRVKTRRQILTGPARGRAPEPHFRRWGRNGGPHDSPMSSLERRAASSSGGRCPRGSGEGKPQRLAQRLQRSAPGPQSSPRIGRSGSRALCPDRRAFLVPAPLPPSPQGTDRSRRPFPRNRERVGSAARARLSQPRMPDGRRGETGNRNSSALLGRMCSGLSPVSGGES